MAARQPGLSVSSVTNAAATPFDTIYHKIQSLLRQLPVEPQQILVARLVNEQPVTTVYAIFGDDSTISPNYEALVITNDFRLLRDFALNFYLTDTDEDEFENEFQSKRASKEQLQSFQKQTKLSEEVEESRLQLLVFDDYDDVFSDYHLQYPITLDTRQQIWATMLRGARHPTEDLYWEHPNEALITSYLN